MQTYSLWFFQVKIVNLLSVSSKERTVGHPLLAVGFVSGRVTRSGCIRDCLKTIVFYTTWSCYGIKLNVPFYAMFLSHGKGVVNSSTFKLWKTKLL